MGDTLGKIFVDPSALPDDEFGFMQVCFLGLVYAYVLAQSSNMISDGSELLLLVPSLKGIVGSVVLPVLGAVPDGAIVLFSGLGPDAAEQVAVGVGALAGSTIMLLTIPWFLSIVGGRVDIVNDSANYRRPKGAKDFQKLTKGWSLTETGIEAAPSLARNGYVMIATAMTYAVIQIPATGLGCDMVNGDCNAAGQKWWAFAGMCTALLSFCGYLYYQVKNNANEGKSDMVIQQKVLEGQISVAAVFQDQLLGKSSNSDSLIGNDTAFNNLCLQFFKTIDRDNNGSIDLDEFRFLIYNKMALKMTEDQFTKIMKDFDSDNTGEIDFSEFKDAMTTMVLQGKDLFRARRPSFGDVQKLTSVAADSSSNTYNTFNGEGVDEAEEEEEEPEMPDDILALPKEQQQRRVLYEACKLMTIGTVLVLLFSDPMVDVMSSLGKRVGVKSFYVSFVLAPLASNLCEVIASYNYASKKTSRSITIALETLHGASSMNNTFCLGIFLALVFFKGLAWEFTAETITILVVQLAIAAFSLKRVHTLATGICILSLYPLSLALVYGLEAVGLN